MRPTNMLEQTDRQTDRQAAMQTAVQNKRIASRGPCELTHAARIPLASCPARRPSRAPLVGRPPPTGRAPRPLPARPSTVLHRHREALRREPHPRPRRPRRLVVLRRGQLVGAPLRPHCAAPDIPGQPELQ
eukprot:scaffold27954_cov70-Phaeocystis_antarctica.AAC.5